MGGAREGSRLIGCDLCKFSSNFLDNWSDGNSLMVNDCLALTVDGGGAIISSKMLIFDRCVFWEVCGRARLDWMCLCEFSSNFREN